MLGNSDDLKLDAPRFIIDHTTNERAGSMLDAVMFDVMILGRCGKTYCWQWVSRQNNPIAIESGGNNVFLWR